MNVFKPPTIHNYPWETIKAQELLDQLATITAERDELLKDLEISRKNLAIFAGESMKQREALELACKPRQLIMKVNDFEVPILLQNETPEYWLEQVRKDRGIEE